MPYTHTTFAQLKSELSSRLDDTGRIFWVDAEITMYLTEAIRLFGLASGFWRERGTLSTSSSVAFYDINQNLSNGMALILKPTVTDQDIILQLQYALLETNATVSQSSWAGTEMFTFNDVANAVQNRLNQFMSETGTIVNRSLINVASPPIGRQTLDQKTIDVRRAAWLGAPPLNYYTPLWREDERLLTAADQTWSVTDGQPEAYSIMAPPPLQIQIAPPPQSSGQLELLTVDSIPLNPAAGPTVLGIPDQLTAAITWGALADLLGKDGIAMDQVRSEWCDQRYQIYVKLARMLPVIIHAEINGVPLIPCTLQEIESSSPTWENMTGVPSDIAAASTNLIALNPPPDGVYSITLDVVRQPPITGSDGVYVQIGREQLDAIVDYAEHLALFKCHGVEWHATERAAQNFMIQALTYNQRISAAARSAFSASFISQMQKKEIPRRLSSGVGTGALMNA